MIFNYLNPDHGAISNIIRLGLNMALPSFLKWTRLTRAAFVATKADMVCEYHRDNLKLLTEELCRKVSHDYNGLLTKVFSCSAICSTETLEDNALKGTLEGHSSVDIFRISEVPEQWPDTWKEGDFQFGDVMPKWPIRKDSVPNHLNMDAVFRYIMSEGILE
jgi:predicted YcjX-like family ATPase